MNSWVHAISNPDSPEVLPTVRLFAVLGTWMEEDVVGSTVRNALTQGCERVYLVETRARDSTVEAAIDAGATLAKLYATAHYDEVERIKHLNDVVATVSSAEPDEHIWWLDLDADEFPPWTLGAHAL